MEAPSEMENGIQPSYLLVRMRTLRRESETGESSEMRSKRSILPQQNAGAGRSCVETEQQTRVCVNHITNWM